MAEYEKLEDSKTHFTGPIAGQLYIRFLKFEGLDSSISATNMPAISVQIDNESGLHPHLDFNPKKIVQSSTSLSLTHTVHLMVSLLLNFQLPLPKVPELLLFIRSRLNKVRIEFKHPQSQEDLGTATIEPARVADAKLNTVWFRIGDTAKVLAHVYWGALHIHDKFTNRLTELQLSTFTIVLDRPQYLAGETVTGIVVYRPRKPKDLKHVKLQIAGFSRQLSEDDASYESKHVFFNHEAILMGFAGSTSEAIQVKPGFYIWTFAFPLPYAIPSSGITCGNFYYIAARQVDMAGNISKSLKLTFGIRKTFFPRDLMEAAIDAPPNLTPHPQQAAVLTSEPGAPASAAPPTEDFEDEMSNVRRSTHIAKLMQSEEDSDSDEGNSVEDSDGGSSEEDEDDSDMDSESDEISKPDSDVPKKKKKTTSSPSKKKKSSKSSEASKPKKKSKTSASEPKSALKTSNPGKSQSEVEPASNPAPGSSQSQSDDAHAKKSAAGVYKSATVIATGPDGKSSIVMAVQPTLHVNVRVPLRVKPGIGIQVRPSGGMKHLTVPIEVENTTEKALVHFHVALNCITQKTLWQHLFLGGTRPYTIHAKYLIKKFKFKKEPGWPLAPGQKWQGTVTLALPESVPPSIDDAVSPLFSRTYYVKICSAAKGLFTKHKVETKKAVLLPDYDYFTRPLPIQHVFNQPIRFTIFTMPATAVAPTFVTDPTAPSIDHSTAVAVDIEQSEAIDLDTSTIF